MKLLGVHIYTTPDDTYTLSVHGRDMFEDPYVPNEYKSSTCRLGSDPNFAIARLTKPRLDTGDVFKRTHASREEGPMELRSYPARRELAQGTEMFKVVANDACGISLG